MNERRPAAIEVVDATKVIDGLTVLDHVTFAAHPGRVTAFLGPNGAGKSTMLRAIVGIDRLDAGYATVGGRPFAAHPRPAQVVGALLTPDAAHPKRTAWGHLVVVAASNGLPRRAAGAAIELVGISDIRDVAVGEMSLGMRQRLALATALIGDPAVVILDEPHNGLDASAIRWLRDVLRTLAAGARTVLVSSHLMSEVELIADDAVVLDQGRVVATGTLDSVRAGSGLEERYLELVGNR